MLNWFMKQMPENDLVGGYGSGAAPAKVPPPPPTVTQPPPAAKAEAPGSDDDLDDYGYEKVPSVEAAKEAAAAAAAPAKKEAAPEIKEPVAGYGAEPLKAEVPETPPPPAAAEIKLDYEVDVKDLPKEEADKMKKFALDQKLPKEAAQALLDLRKGEFDSYKAEMVKIESERKTAIAQQKASWDKELREDPTFGGDQFVHNLARADKVLTTLMPDTKKVLTERKSMLPPYVMRDLVKVYNHMYGTDSLVQGDSPAPTTEKKESSPLDFYE